MSKNYDPRLYSNIIGSMKMYWKMFFPIELAYNKLIITITEVIAVFRER